MKRLLILFTLCLTFFASQSFAQEICNNNLDDDGDGLVDCRDGNCPGKVCETCDNGIDDDGDGFIDCYDKECNIETPCEDFFLGKDPACEVRPDSFPPFQMRLKFKSLPNQTNHINRIIAGDVDNDGIPELVTAYAAKIGASKDNVTGITASKINIFQAPTSGNILNLETSINVPLTGLQAVAYEDIAMADINKDGCAEIFIVTKDLQNSNNYKIVAYNCNQTLVWAAPISFSFDPGVMGLADFDGDGLVELYSRTQIFDAHTGAFMGNNNIDNTNTGIHSGVNKGWGMNSNASIAVDIDAATPGLELVAGCRIYSVVINRGAMTATLTLTKELSNYATRTSRGHSNSTSVADFNQDGKLDVLAVGSDGAYDANTTIFFWDPNNPTPNTHKKYKDLSVAGADYSTGWKNGAGRINIADVDGDTLMNAVYVSGKYLYALKESASKLDTLWRRLVTEETSGITGCTMFDFNADGKSEIVYRDEDYIYIYTTETIGTVTTVTRSTPVRCSSRTSNEYPIVVDMDGDGSTEICVTCSTTNATNGKSLGIWDEAEVRVYESANEPWVPARRVWNQHGYFVTNVNDNLTIPKVQQLHHLIYAKNAQCRKFGTSRPLNSFLNQSPYLNSFGCPSFPAPDLAVTPVSPGFPFDFEPPTCPVDSFEITFKIKNLGDIKINGIVNVSFYNGDPEAVSPLATRLLTKPFALGTMSPGDSIILKTFVKGPGSAFRLYVVINDDGTTIPLAIEKQKNRIPECEYNNIISDDIKPKPATLIPELIRNNLACLPVPGAPTPVDNGAVKAYVPIGAIKDSVNFNFYWSDGTVAKPIDSADHIGPIYSGLAVGTYTVYAVHKVVSCGSNPVSIDVGSDPLQITANVSVVNQYTNCQNPDGELRVDVDRNGDGVGENPSDFTYIWYDGPDILVGDTLGISNTLVVLSPGSYSVLVYDKATGCPSNDSGDILNETITPVIDTTHVNVDCSAVANGVASAWVNPPKTTTGFTFYWSNGSIAKPTEDFRGADYLNRPAGNYTVFAENDISKCKSDTLTVTVEQVLPPVITGIVKNSDQTSCKPGIFLGSATISIQGNIADHDFQWFRGQNTVAANAVAGATNATATGLEATIYTVRVTNRLTNCSNTEEILIGGPITPTLTTIPTTQSNCVPLNGGVTVNSVSVGAIADYTFEWTGFPANQTPTLANLEGNLSYTVRGKNITSGCFTPNVITPVMLNIPVVNLAPPTLIKPSTCFETIGSIEVNVTTVNIGGYAFEWFKGGAPVGTPLTSVTSTSTTSLLSGLKTGTYTVEITNLETGCKSNEQIVLPVVGGHELAPFAQTDITTCVPTDGGTITSELTPTIGFTDINYSIFLYDGSLDPEPTIDNGLVVTAGPAFRYLSNGPFNTTTKYYTMVAVAGSSTGLLQGCRSAVTFEIKKVTADPVIDANLTASMVVDNINCNITTPGNPSGGSITLAVGGVPTDYDYAWTSIDDPAFTASTKDLTLLKPGEYKVVVTDNGGLNAGCFVENSFTVLDNPQDITAMLADGDFIINDISECEPDGMTPLTQGSFTFNKLVVDGVDVLPTFPGYVFDWRADDDTVIPDNDAVAGNLTNILPGDYYVIARNPSTNCDITKSFTVIDETLNSVGVELSRFTLPQRCYNPIASNDIGELVVKATGSSANPADYTYSWFEGTGTTTPLVPPTGTIVNDTIATNLVNGTFTIRVFNNITKCLVTDTYIVPMDSADIFLNVSSSPLTFCSLPDGAVYAIVTSGNQDDYDYEWYAGTSNVPPVATSPIVANVKLVTGQLDAVYLVVATDINDPTCFATDTIAVEDLRVFPVVTALPINPVTNCDELIPNGSASASVGGNVIDYAFNWFGETITPLDTMAVGSQISALADSTYTVVASDRVTGCADTTQVTINFMPAGVVNPTIKILSHVTSCVEDNGSLSVSVDGNTADYIFEWYVGLVEKPVPDFTGDYLDSLAIGIYSVKATSKITGCVSPLVSEEILFTPIYPEFKIDILPAPCDEDAGEIYLTITNGVEIGSIVWETPNGEVIGNPVLQGIPAGHYIVTIISQLGCSASREVDVKSEIHPFNGISRNNDGKNDTFWINCIDDFPDNVVRIFNRAGTMVYEEHGYDNIDIYFDGISNKGISVMGTNLPDGTYFYVIDKRDGSKPLAGYLEIVN